MPAAAVLLWCAGGWLGARRASPEASVPAFGVGGSAYGSLMARLMRDSLYSYWHGGRRATTEDMDLEKETKASPSSSAMPPSVFARRRAHVDAVPSAEGQGAAASVGPLDRCVRELARLDAFRTRRNSPFAPSQAHRRFLNSEADWRLRLAYELDPGDAVLYEILHFHIASRQDWSAERREQEVRALARRAMDRALEPDATLSDALTGAGAAINLLNEELQPDRHSRADDPDITKNHAALKACLARYDAIRAGAEREGWWTGIPDVRRGELEDHARLLKKIAEAVATSIHNAERPSGTMQ